MTIADEAASRGLKVLHIVNDQAGSILRSNGVSRQIITSHKEPLADMRVGDVTHVITDICRAGNGKAAHCEIANWTNSGKFVAVIDAMPPDHFTAVDGPPPDIVFTPYLNARSHRPAPEARHWMVGANFAVLSRAYWQSTPQPSDTKPRILVTCGGSDPDHLTAKILPRLTKLGVPIDVVTGALFDVELMAEVEELSAKHPMVTVHHAPNSLADLIRRSALVVGRLGLTRYEVAAMGRNAIWLSAGTAYRDYLEAFEREGLAKIYFDGDPTGTEDFLKALDALKDLDRRAEMFRPNKRAGQLVDGNGAKAMIDAILANSAAEE